MGAEGLLEQHAFGGEAVEVGRGEPLVAVRAHVVAAQRVDAKEDDVWFLLAASRHMGSSRSEFGL